MLIEVNTFFPIYYRRKIQFEVVKFSLAGVFTGQLLDLRRYSQKVCKYKAGERGGVHTEMF